MNQLIRDLINLAGYEVNAAFHAARYQPARARALIEKIKVEEVALVAENG